MTNPTLPSNEGVATPPQVSTPSPSPEKFNLKKFLQGMFSINAVTISKDVVGLFSIRKIIIYLLVAGSIYGWGYWKGIKGKPVYFNLQNKSATIKLNEHYLQILRDGRAKVVNNKGQVLKTIKVSDIPQLEKALRPISFQFNPFIGVGGSVGTKKITQPEIAVGASLYKFYKIQLNAWLTQYGYYAGPSYSITDNTSILGGIGKGYTENDTRLFMGVKVNF